MPTDREVALALCWESSQKGGELKPLTTAEFYKLFDALNINNSRDIQLNIFDNPPGMSFNEIIEAGSSFFEKELKLGEALTEKIIRLLGRINSYIFELEKLERSGFKVITLFDPQYPKKLKSALNTLPNSMRCPPVFYCAGSPEIADLNFVGFAGSRDVDDDDKAWIRGLVKQIAKKNKSKGELYGVTSGGAAGADRTAQDAALKLNLPVVEFSKNMRATLRDEPYMQAVREERAVLFSHINPYRSLTRQEAGAYFMARNKYIYALSDYTVIAKSANGRGGTWSGAVEALKHNLSEVYVRKMDCEGNIALIDMGAHPLKR